MRRVVARRGRWKAPRRLAAEGVAPLRKRPGALTYFAVLGQEQVMSFSKLKLTTNRVILSPALLAFTLLPAMAVAQEFEDVKPSVGILSLKQQGSFFIG